MFLRDPQVQSIAHIFEKDVTFFQLFFITKSLKIKPPLQGENDFSKNSTSPRRDTHFGGSMVPKTIPKSIKNPPTVGSLWDDFGITLGSLGINWGYFRIIWGSFWDDFRASSDPLGGLRSSLGRQVGWRPSCEVHQVLQEKHAN